MGVGIVPLGFLPSQFGFLPFDACMQQEGQDGDEEIKHAVAQVEESLR